MFWNLAISYLHNTSIRSSTFSSITSTSELISTPEEDTTTAGAEEGTTTAGDVTIDCSTCPDIQFSTCNVLQGFSLEFEAIVKTTLERRGPGCSCLSGFLPLYDPRGSLARCVDPVVRTGAVLGRCLLPQHCSHLPNTVCARDTQLSDRPGFQNYFTCQCRAGHQVIYRHLILKIFSEGLTSIITLVFE